MRNSRLDRILYIQQVLVQGGVLNKQQMADRFGVSEKTIQRDLDTLRNHFADSEPRREILYNSAKGGYLLDDTLSRFLTSSEILAVCKILLESRSMVKEEMFPILDKLVQVCTPLDRLNQVKDLIQPAVLCRQAHAVKQDAVQRPGIGGELSETAVLKESFRNTEVGEQFARLPIEVVEHHLV